MMRICGCILGVALLCGISSEGIAMAASTLPAGVRAPARITKVAHRHKKPKHQRPSPLKHRKNNHAPAKRRQ
jgi:hypothetical protein